MDRFGVSWELANIEPLSAWAEELKVIPSTTVTVLRKRLVECDARLLKLTGELAEPEPVPSPPRKSSRTKTKVTSVVTNAPAPTAGPLKPGAIFINSTPVFFFLYWFVRVLKFLPSVIGVLGKSKSASRKSARVLGAWGAKRRSSLVSI